MRLACWCEAHGLIAERHKHLAIALEIKPEHAAAHGLLGQIADKGDWRMPAVVIDEHRGDAEGLRKLELYRARRDKIPDTAQAHWQLAQWCEENELRGEAVAHLTAVVRLNPVHEEARKKLGYRKQKGRWTASDQSTAEQRTETDAQRKAEAKWVPLLQKWDGRMDRKGRRAEAETAMAAVRDPRAVSSIWKVFIRGGPSDQARAVRLLGQIDAPAASRALASLAAFGISDEVRLSAAERLIHRDPREFAPFLIGLMRDPIKYEVKYVGEPGSPGELYVHGKRMNQRFFYAAPPPLTTFRPTDIVGYDDYGMPIANRIVGYTYQSPAAAIDPQMSGSPDLSGAPQFLAKTGLGPVAGTRLGERIVQNQQQAAAIGSSMGTLNTVLMPLRANVPVGQLTVIAARQAEFSRTRLREDVAALDRYNKDVNQVNDRATAALEIALLENHGPQSQAWTKWWSDLVDSATSATPAPARHDANKADAQPKTAEKRAILPGFGAHTPVWTNDGIKPIEVIRAGDLVLAQDTTSGALSFAPVLMIHRTELQRAKTVTIGDIPMCATDVERFWVAAKGWKMVVDLKAGDAIRALGDVVRVASIEDAGAQPIYHVQVAPGLAMLVGTKGVLAHDERVALPVSSAFDAAENGAANGLPR